MKLTFIANACCIYESQGYKILCDPWLTPGAFYGSWFHIHPLKTKPSDIADFDALYISHLHPDHFDPETLKHFDKSKPVIILDRPRNYIKRMVRAEGFTNIHMIKDGEAEQFGPFKITMFGPFCKHPFFHSELGNLIDSAIVVQDENTTVFNANDNTPNEAAAEMLRDRFPKINVAQLNYNCAGPYPSCFGNMSDEERLKEASRLVDRNLDHAIKICEILEADYWMPFAGEYLIGGRNWRKNAYLGTITSKFAAGYALGKGLATVSLSEGEWIDIESYTSFVDGADLAAELYDYEKPINIKSAWVHLRNFDESLFDAAALHVRSKQEQLNCFPSVSINICGYTIHLDKDQSGIGNNQMKADMDWVLIHGILTGKYHWNNAEIGCHIEFTREPNVYNPDVHMLLSFLHIPKGDR